MKTLHGAMQDHLDGGATTLCWCWKMTRPDGTVMGFTDHDGDVRCADTRYAAATGISASEVQSACDYSVDNMEISGAFNAEALNESDLAAGLYDGAAIEIFRVNWADPSQYALIRKGWLGEVKRGANGFQAELRGLMQRLAQPVGRAFCYLCDADLGDGRCGIDIRTGAYTGTGVVIGAADSRRFTASGLDGFAAGWFSGGKLVWTAGANAGLAADVKSHAKTAAAVALELWQAAGRALVPGDGFTVTAGCDKNFATCKEKFANGVNRRGFPYLIGDNAVMAYANGATDLDGGSRYGN